MTAIVEPPPAFEVALGEALVQQSSGRHRPQAALGVSLAVPVAGRWGIAAEVLGTFATERSSELALDQWLVRPAVLATLSFARPITTVPRARPAADGSATRPSAWLSFDVGLGPTASATIAHWVDPDLGAAVLVEPGVRGRAGLALGVSERARLRFQGGLAWRPSGVDHDFTLGLAWAL